MSSQESLVTAWLQTPTGTLFADAEREFVSTELGRLFGGQFLQLGLWGDPEAFLPVPGTARRALCHDHSGPGVSFLGRAEHLPVAGHSVDALLLPHTLEMTQYPHEVLRQAERALCAGGRIVILGFNPISPLGLRRLLSPSAYPPGLRQLVSERRLRDWMNLLAFDVTLSRHYFPYSHAGQNLRERLRRVQLSYGAYMLIAVKRMYAVTPTRLRWRTPAKVGAGLIEPSTRNSG